MTLAREGWKQRVGSHWSVFLKTDCRCTYNLHSLRPLRKCDLFPKIYFLECSAPSSEYSIDESIHIDTHCWNHSNSAVHGHLCQQAIYWDLSFLQRPIPYGKEAMKRRKDVRKDISSRFRAWHVAQKESLPRMNLFSIFTESHPICCKSLLDRDMKLLNSVDDVVKIFHSGASVMTC